MTVTFSIIVPTKGRATLARTLASCAAQLEHGDEILVQRLDCHYGNQARDNALPKASGTHLLFIDDDDAYTDGALATMRTAIADKPDKIHIFRMRYPDGRVLWASRTVVCGNVGSPMVAIPNIPATLASWTATNRYEADFDFLRDTLRRRGDQPEFHEQVVALVRPA